MNTPITGSNKFPLITFRMKNGKVDRVEVEGNTEEQNKAFGDRVIVSNEAREIAERMAQAAKNPSNAFECRNGRLIGVRPMPVSCYNGYGEVKVGDYTKRISNDTGLSDYTQVGDKVQVSGKDFGNADEINRFLYNLCFYGTFGQQNISNDGLWKNSWDPSFSKA